MTTFIAWLALVVSAASLAWQVVSWRSSGPRIRVQLTEITPKRDVPGAYMIVLANDGRQAATVPEVRVRSKNGYPLDAEWGVDIEWVHSDPLPVTVEPGGEARLYTAHAYMKESIFQAGQAGRQKVEHWHLIPEARVGTTWVSGTWKTTPWSRNGGIPSRPED